MIRRLLALFVTICLALPLSSGRSAAQSLAWVQIEATPTLAEAVDRIRAYAARLPDVAGYQLRSGYYGIVLGPYAPDDAAQRLRTLRASAQIPSDSYIQDGSRFAQQFWPVGAGAALAPQPLPGAAETVAAPEQAITVPDETRSQALASESLLTRDERELLQTALKWAGFYDAAIDGAFGRGTRSSMAAWQQANGYDTTGILTTAQRAALISAYNAVLDGMDLQTVRDAQAGISIKIPTGVVAFDAYNPPFARYSATGDVPAQVLLISQEGDADRMAGLYQILQTLEKVPTEGPRSLGGTSFSIDGADAAVHTYIEASLSDGAIKGFALIWPAGDEERRTRILDIMKASFATLDGVLDPGIAPPGADQAIDLVAGLQVRQPKTTGSGFYVDGSGSVLTAAAAVTGCERITLDDATEAAAQVIDADLGLALLTPEEPLAPRAVAAFQTAIPRLQSDVAVGGYPFGGILVAPSVTFGKLADLRGLRGETTLKRLALAAAEGDAGGPVLDAGGAVLGMLAPKAPVAGQVLPDEVSFAVDSGAILTALGAAGIAPETTDVLTATTPEMVGQRAADMTVLVSCW